MKVIYEITDEECKNWFNCEVDRLINDILQGNVII